MYYIKTYESTDEFDSVKETFIEDFWVASVDDTEEVYYQDVRNPLCFTALEDNAQISFTYYDFAYDYGYMPDDFTPKKIYIKKNNETDWRLWEFDQHIIEDYPCFSTNTIVLSKGECLYVKSDTNDMSYYIEEYDESIYYQFKINHGKISASGNVMSLMNYANKMTPYGFIRLFYNCSSLTTAPELSATELTDGCYSSMFNNCTSLKTAPELPATTLASYCYYSMFEYCTSLTTAPELPATELTDFCYAWMFNSCTSLTTAPELPATTLADYCYEGMFRSCGALTTAPDLPATTLTDSCYAWMFYGCSKLNYIKVLFTTTPPLSYTYNWVYGVSSTGTFFKSKDTTWDVTGSNGIPSGWDVENEEGLVKFGGLQFKALAPSTITIKQFGDMDDAKSFMYRKNNGQFVEWGTLEYSNDQLSTVNLSTGDVLCVKSNSDTPMSLNCTDDYSEDQCRSFVMKGKIEASGNIMSLLNNNSELQGFGVFSGLFRSCGALTTAPDLPATTLTDACYTWMFYGCTSLTTAPDLPATTLTDYCYEGMFSDCTSLTTAPKLPATTLTDYCYGYMFMGCTSLTKAPELPATTLVNECYRLMFDSCSNLNYIKAMFTTTPSDRYTFDWVYGVPSTGTFVKSRNATWNVTGYNGIPRGWTVQTA